MYNYYYNNFSSLLFTRKTLVVLKNPHYNHHVVSSLPHPTPTHKVFNARTCQLVLGAGAMQTSGLKSITAKHLALACQALGATTALVRPHLQQKLTSPIQQPRRALLLPEFDRVLQDLTVHRDEILGKLVAIMEQRLEGSIVQLPVYGQQWLMASAHHEEGVGGGGGVHPSQFAQSTSMCVVVVVVV